MELAVGYQLDLIMELFSSQARRYWCSVDTGVPVPALRSCFWATFSAIVGIDIFIIVVCITSTMKWGKSSNLWGAPFCANCSIIPLISTVALLSLYITVCNPRTLLGGKFRPLCLCHVIFNMMRREDLLGIAMLYNLRICHLCCFTVHRSGKSELESRTISLVFRHESRTPAHS